MLQIAQQLLQSSTNAGQCTIVCRTHASQLCVLLCLLHLLSLVMTVTGICTYGYK